MKESQNIPEHKDPDEKEKLPPFIEPKLTFIEPKVEKAGSLRELTTFFMGFSP